MLAPSLSTCRHTHGASKQHIAALWLHGCGSAQARDIGNRMAGRADANVLQIRYAAATACACRHSLFLVCMQSTCGQHRRHNKAYKTRFQNIPL